MFEKRYKNNPSLFGRVAVLCGGWSKERDVSLKSGEAVFCALKTAGVDAEKVVVPEQDAKKELITRLTSEKFDRVFIALHGVGGEDGKVQSLLDMLSLPYTGSGAAASSLAMDKVKAKKIWCYHNIKTPNFVELSSATDWMNVFNQLNSSVFVKPVLEGSSIGMSCVNSVEDFEAAYRKAHEFSDSVVAEQTIHGREFTVAILNGVALPPIELATDHEFYDYDAKYIDDSTRYYCPVDLAVEKIKEVQEIAVDAANKLDCFGWCRADFMQDTEGEFYLLEMNTVPGMTDHSLVPMAAKQAGLSFEELVLEILMQTVAVNT